MAALDLASQYMPLLVMYAAIRVDLVLIVRRVAALEQDLKEMKGKKHGNTQAQST